MSLRSTSVVSVSQFDRSILERIFVLADRCAPVARGERSSRVLDGKLLANLFFEPSTRTRLSFGSAFRRLGGRVETTVGMQFSSMAKGESLEDTIRVIDGYADALVLRHPDLGAARRAAAVARRPVINAGDGPGEHPTQALLDAWTLRQECGRIDGLRIALIGDLRYGRTVHSLARLLTRFDDVELVFAAPPQLGMPQAVTDILDSRGLRWSTAGTLVEALANADVAYVTRLQAERFDDPAQAARFIGSYVVNRALLEEAGRTDITLLHPLPRLHDLSSDVDDLPGAAFFRQAHNGVPVRMALFCELFGVEP
jgi:aspartate carbamoyltransferase catalytic subunit